MSGAETQTRTADLLFTKQLLYRLSYPGAREIIGLGLHGNICTYRAFSWSIYQFFHELGEVR